MTDTNILYTDPSGKNTLDAISVADSFNEWMYQVIQAHCQGRILEIGSGTGNISAFFLKNGASIHLSDLRSEYCHDLQLKFNTFPNLCGIDVMDLADPSFDNKQAHLFGSFDSVVALNVIEHIENDTQAIVNAGKLLKPGGKLVILVPAYPWLFCSFDTEFGHFRRYTCTTLVELLKRSGFLINKDFYFNTGGIPGWLIFGKILKRKSIETENMGLFNKLVPIFKLADRIVFHKIGLSVIAIGTKKD